MWQLLTTLVGLLLVFIVLWFSVYTLFVIVRFIWHVLTFDVFGVYYDDPESPYYHDRHGKGRGR